MSDWISAKDKAPQFPCVICTEADRQPRMPLGIITTKLKNGETYYFDVEFYRSDVFEFEKENHISFFTKENSILYWMPVPYPPKERKDDDII